MEKYVHGVANSRIEDD